MSKQRLILVVDDDEAGRTPLVIRLRRNGYEVAEAEDGEAGFRLASERRPDVIISDLDMPRKNGQQMAQEIRAKIPGVEIPIIFLSGGYLSHSKEELSDYTLHCLDKPLEWDVLIATLNFIFAAADAREKKTK